MEPTEESPRTDLAPRFALANPAGELLWSMSPPGTWAAQHAFEARTWAGLDELRRWCDEQPADFRRRLRAEQWAPVVLRAAASPVTAESAAGLVRP